MSQVKCPHCGWWNAADHARCVHCKTVRPRQEITASARSGAAVGVVRRPLLKRVRRLRGV